MAAWPGFLDWGGGLIWLAGPADEACGSGHTLWRRKSRRRSCHACWSRLIILKSAVLPVFHPQPAERFRLTQRIKEGFDPLRSAQSRSHVPGRSEPMETRFDLVQLADPHVKEAERIHPNLRPLRLLPGDLSDLSAAGRRARQPARPDLHDQGHAGERVGPPIRTTVRHVDRCLSCLSCMTTCPSGVNYMHLVDHARLHIRRNL